MNSQGKVVLLLVLPFLFLKTTSFCQENTKSGTDSGFIDAEFLTGRVVPNYGAFPRTKPVKSFSLNIGTLHENPGKAYASYYNHPMTGISVYYSNPGNNNVFGREVGVKPFFMFNPVKSLKNPFYFKFSLGLSYFTEYYGKTGNSENKAVGSPFTWNFQAFLYKSWNINQALRINLGAGYLHSSNGHIQLPNAGLNKAMFSISATRFFKRNSENVSIHPDNSKNNKNRFFYNLRNGLGIHELGNAFGPTGGPKKGVFSLALSGGVIFNNHIKLRSGLTYRFYEHYYDYIITEEIPGYSDKPFVNATNLNFFIGCEFLVGHFGLDVEGGLNMYKPFYNEFFQRFQSGGHFKYILKNYFSSRLGLNLYLYNTHERPKNNFFIGANINANFGQADFSELSVGYTRLLNKE